VPPLAVNVELLPAQTVVLPLIEAEGMAFTVSALLSEAVQPLAAVAVTVYVPAVETLIAAVVAPVLHI